jgi:hypothetical protein
VWGSPAQAAGRGGARALGAGGGEGEGPVTWERTAAQAGTCAGAGSVLARLAGRIESLVGFRERKLAGGRTCGGRCL